MHPRVVTVRRREAATPIPGVSPLSFLALPLFDMLVFAIPVGAAFYYRHRADVHKRLMDPEHCWAACGAGCPAAASDSASWTTCVLRVADFFIAVCLAYDPATRRRIHPSSALGALIIVLSQPC